MVARSTIGSYKVKAILTHGDCFYDYSQWPAEWVPAATKVTTICTEHGPFEQQISVHARGQGCRKCNPKKISASNSKNTHYYLKKADKAHGGKYDYSKVPEGSLSLSIVPIICPIHGVFNQRLERHASGAGCVACVKDTSLTGKQKRLDRCNAVHDNFYDYSQWPERVTSKSKVKILCPIHGEFTQSILNHEQGQGCPSCNVGGFNVNKSGYLYMLRSRCGCFMKIGITKNPKKRLADLRYNTPFELDMVAYSFFEEGSHARDLEKAFHNLCKSAKFKGFCGATEWFKYDNTVYEVICSLR